MKSRKNITLIATPSYKMYDFQIRCGALYFSVKNNATHHVHAYVHTKVYFMNRSKKVAQG